MTSLTRHRALRFVPAAGAFFLLVGAPAAPAFQEGPAASAEPGHASAPYQRITEDADGHVMRLEMAVREFAPSDPDDPTVYLAGAIHIADRPFYEALQQFLDAQDVVLFEGVKPAGAGDHFDEMDDAEKAAATKRRVRFLAVSVERFKARHDSYPADLDALIAGTEGRFGELIRSSRTDAWGNDLVYTLAPADAGGPAFDIVSLGADGSPGGEGDAADLKFSDAKPLTAAERGQGGPGMQQRLADALGLVFQLTAMNHDRPNWRNSDMSIDQVQRRLEATGADGSQLFAMLDGSSMTARFAGFILRFIGASPTLQATGKIALMEMLGRADELLRAGAGGMGKLMAVILDERNDVVMADLRRVLEEEPGVKSIGIIYGAGHLPDLERRLVEELGYRPAEDRWFSAIAVDLKAAGITPAQARQTRQMIAVSLERQLRAAQRRPAAESRP